MNKKKLSVVMAGAMLASSVAPVLAAEVVKEEVSADNLGLLIQKIRTQLESKTFANETDDDKRVNVGEAGKSVYFIKINGVEYKDAAIDEQSELQALLGNLAVGTKVEIWSKGFEEKDGKYYAKKEAVPTYANTKELSDLVTPLGTKLSAITDSVVFNTTDDTLKITFKKALDMSPIVLAVGDEKYDFDNFRNTDTDSLDVITNATVNNFGGFPKKAAELGDIASEKVEEVTITAGGYNLQVSDLYDGLMLTEKGHDFFTKLKEAKAMSRSVKVVGNVDTNQIISETEVANKIKLVNGKVKFTVEFEEVHNMKYPKETYTIVGTNEKEAERLVKWILAKQAKVDILAGANRYETAAKIAEEYAGLTGDNVALNNSDDVNIVLVNGNALVDGLAASPLASAKANTISGDKVSAPILLTESNELPKATKAYLKEVLKNVEVGDLDRVTVNLVGGESVLNKSLERELKGLGFNVERFGGDNREETSLEVAEAIGNTNSAFVVGADGEADAMSIASVAAELKTPIIVAKRGGISEDAVYELKNKVVTIVGGESVVTDTELNDIKAEASGVLRVFGSNRQATNAEVINKYYKSGFAGKAENVIVAKDGQNNKSELVDALAAANFASNVNAPIVLATNKLSDAQVNALELNATGSKALYQVGNGVARDVVKTIAQRLGLAN